MNADLTTLMREYGIKYVSAVGDGFFVCLHGGWIGTGLTVGEALQAALAQRPERLAA